jgi:hypothetical protein
VGPKAVLDAVVKRKISSPRQESNPDRIKLAQDRSQWLFYVFSVMNILISKQQRFDWQSN